MPTPAEPASPVLRALESRRGYFLVLGLVVVLGLASEARSLVGSDIGFLLYAARRVVDGARLYRDVVEINPPLIVALNVPAIILARVTGCSEITSYRFLTTLLLGGSLLSCAALLRRIVPAELETFRRWVVVLIAVALFLVGAPDYGQREHLLLALVLPYLLLAVARARGVPISAIAAASIGIAAGIGFSFKPHFLLVLLAVELARLAMQRTRHPGVELVALGGTILTYVGAIWLWVPEYPPLLRLLGPEYAHFLRVPFTELLLSGRGAPLVLLTSVLSLGLVSRSRHRELWVFLLVTMLAAFVAGAAQEKGWRYHFYPALALTLVSLGVIAADAPAAVSDGIRRGYASVALAAALTGATWFAGLSARRAAGLDAQYRRGQERFDQLVHAVQGQHGRDLYIFSFVMASGFPLVNYTGLEWASRFPHLWILVSVYHDQLTADRPLEYRDRARMGRAERLLNDAVYEDLATHRPALLLVLRHARDVRASGPRRIDYLGYFARDPRTANLLRDYRYRRRVGEYLLYQRLPDGEPRPAQLSLPGPGSLDLPPHQVHGWTGLRADGALLLQVLVCSLLTIWAFRSRHDSQHQYRDFKESVGSERSSSWMRRNL